MEKIQRLDISFPFRLFAADSESNLIIPISYNTCWRPWRCVILASSRLL